MKITAKFLLPAALAVVLVGCAATVAHKWEYRTRTVKHQLKPFMLNNYGRAGWELTEVVRVEVADTNSPSGTNLDYEYIFKRPKK